ncbi:MAG: SDR family NAD(P)-dependent oxidoreductase [Aequoribacter sp.]|jgi:NAD(P)-dependent dehydrogenase (short-subunit alcohol dehydrogenase family)|uniref:SDR family NAD(P)-dependent oxidoreductase n=1 Tax=Aequoribacter sp. TaxID=2847771 RepID=UPI003C503198
MVNYENKVVLLSGGGTGIGEATALLLAKIGAKVVVCGRREELLLQVVEQIRNAGGTALAKTCDIADEEQVRALFSIVIREYGQLDLLVNNATLLEASLIDQHPTDVWHKNFTVTVDGTLFMMREAYPYLAKTKGAVVNVSSVVAQLGTPYMTGYAAAKGAVNSMTRNAAIEWAPAGVRVNAVVPGAILTEPTKAVIPDEGSKQYLESLIPMKRIGNPEEVAEAIAFLGSSAASYITGVLLPVDGGRQNELSMGAVSMDGA